jgi:hypothetical protein
MNKLDIKLQPYKKCAHCLKDDERFSMYYYMSLPCNTKTARFGSPGSLCVDCYRTQIEKRKK